MAQFDHVTWVKFLDPAWRPQIHRWYCGHCIDLQEAGDGWHGPAAVRGHARNHLHEDAEPEEGYDYMSGDDLRRTLKRYWRRAMEAVVKFERQLETITTVDDFLTDCGDTPLPDMEWDD